MTSFKEYLEEQLLDEEFAEAYEQVSDEMDFALALAMRREELELTQHALSIATGIKQPMIARIESGQMPTAPTLQRLAKALSVNIVFTGFGVMLVPFAGRPKPRVAEIATAAKEDYESTDEAKFEYKPERTTLHKPAPEEEYIS
jgi:transcriptional regulator with XRE-family HTH domain